MCLLQHAVVYDIICANMWLYSLHIVITYPSYGILAGEYITWLQKLTSIIGNRCYYYSSTEILSLCRQSKVKVVQYTTCDDVFQIITNLSNISVIIRCILMRLLILLHNIRWPNRRECATQRLLQEAVTRLCAFLRISRVISYTSVQVRCNVS